MPGLRKQVQLQCQWFPNRPLARVLVALSIAPSSARSHGSSPAQSQVGEGRPGASLNGIEIWVRVLADASRYFEAARHVESGLVRDGFDASDAGDITEPATYAKIPNIALDLHFLTVVAAGDYAAEMSTPEALSRIEHILSTLEQMPHWNGFFYDWYVLDGKVPSLALDRQVVLLDITSRFPADSRSARETPYNVGEQELADWLGRHGYHEDPPDSGNWRP